MKFPVFSLLTGNLAPPRDEFAPDCLLRQGVCLTGAFYGLQGQRPGFRRERPDIDVPVWSNWSAAKAEASANPVRVNSADIEVDIGFAQPGWQRRRLDVPSE